jgi:6-phosphogluconolactonase (cycloisomerase 2 family)
MGGNKVTAARRALAVAMAFGVALIAAGATLAATGEIAPQECTDDNDPPARDSCAREADGLGGVVAGAPSPDGRSYYAASVTDDAIAEFVRGQSGALEAKGCADDNDSGADACAKSADGLDGAFSVAVSPDGASVYVAAFDDDAIARFDRDPDTGALSPQGCVDDNDAGQGPDTCTQSADGLDGVISVAVSPDGDSVYAASLDDDALVGFDRDPETGALSPQGCVDDNDSGADTCAQSADGLDGARSVAVSPEGESIYVASGADEAVVRFNRDPESGRVGPQGCVEDDDGGPDACNQSTEGLDGARAVAVSPNGESVYAGAQIDDAIVSFDRDPDGSLEPEGCVDDNDSGADDCAQSVDGLDGVFSIAPSPDGLSLYAAALDDDAVARFDRDPDSGGLIPQGCVDDDDSGPDACGTSTNGLDGAIGITPSAGTTSLYLQSVYDEAVVWFVRQDEAPPETTITKAPRAKTKKRRARFAFTSSEPFSTFECKLDKRGFKPCPSPRAYSKKLLRPGEHAFRVRALDEPGNTDPTPAKTKWRVRR